MLKYYSGALNRADVDVRLGTRLDEQSVNLLDHVDIIIFAMGSTISVPQMFQRPSRPTLSVFEALSQPGTLGTKVVIIGANCSNVRLSLCFIQSTIKFNIGFV